VPPPRVRRAPTGVLLLILLAGAVYWLRGRPEVRREPGLSVLLITVDTLRADAVGAYGKANALTPTIDRLAAAGVRFDDAHAHNVVTLPSHANILSGRYPQDHGVRDNAGFRFPAGIETLATLLKARGYATGAFVSAFPLASRFGLARGFDVYDDSFVDAESRPAFLEQERRGTETVALARRWMAEQGDRPLLCWIHIYEPHAPYRPDEPFASRFRGDPYRGEVAAADAALAPLLEPLLAQGDRGRTLVVLTADHGESLGEHGESTHGIFAYEATLRVPLILHQPRLFAPRVASAPARHVDVLPTILDAVALPLPEGLAGHSLLRTAGGAVAGDTTTYFEALSGQLNRGWAPLHGVIRDRKKYIDLPIPELYDLRRDPSEANNLAAARPVPVDALRSVLAPFRAADHEASRKPESAQARERLRSLGYVSGGTGQVEARDREEDDPKRLITLDAMLQDVVRIYAAGDLRSALLQCRELVRLRPGMAISLLHLAHLERESGHLPAAVEALQKALAVDPGDTTTLSLLGTYLTQAGRAHEAVDLLEAAARVEQPDVEVLIARGLALARTGRIPEALASLTRAREVDPANAMVLVDVGTVQLMGGARERARETFEAALLLSPNLARAHSSLGFLLAENGRAEDAISHWRKAVALDSGESGKLVALAMVLEQRGRAAEARPYLELFVTSAPPALYARDIERARAWLGGSPGARRKGRSLRPAG
jgi:arylsulfatase A-like enzyme/tetratricopeptide (TPR) repeat protein